MILLYYIVFGGVGAGPTYCPNPAHPLFTGAPFRIQEGPRNGYPNPNHETVPQSTEISDLGTGSSRLKHKQGISSTKSTKSTQSTDLSATSDYLSLYRELVLTAYQCSSVLPESPPTIGGGQGASLTFSEKDWNKNFASLDCGAKLVKCSETAKNAGHLMSKSRDEYMLWECSGPLSFVIELCETVKVSRFEVENHELYAGSPRQLEISVAHKYTVNPRDWVHLGNFTSAGEKKVAERFTNPRENVFGKFVRVQVLSNHGEEHFCTLTSFRVYGVSEYEVLAEEDSETAEDVEERMEQSISSLGDKLNEFSILTSRHRVETSRNNVVETFKYLYLHLRNDTCIDTLTLKILEKETRQLRQISPATTRVGGLEVFPAPREGGLDKYERREEESRSKESILVQLNSRLKTLEKNATLIWNLARQLNQTSSIHSSDMERILEAVIRAKEAFKESSKDHSAIKTRIKQLSERSDKFKDFMKESTQQIKLVVLSLILVAVFLLHNLCSLEPTKRTDALRSTRDTATMTETEPEGPKLEPGGERLDPGAQLERIPEHRRSTWCGGSRGRLTRGGQKESERLGVCRRIRELVEEEYSTEPHALSPADTNRDPQPDHLMDPPPLPRLGAAQRYQDNSCRAREDSDSLVKSIIIEEVLDSSLFMATGGLNGWSSPTPPLDWSLLSLDALTPVETGVGRRLQGGRRVTWCGAGKVPSSRPASSRG